ncbi:MAG TPA: DinB family protein [Methylomirabilota bacterium]|nr:DinB family protein [Methylomirabilota bacterium]
MTTADTSAASPERQRVLDYIHSRAEGMRAAEIRARVHAAGAELEAALDGVGAADARRRPPDGGWSAAQVVDHVAQTTIRVAEELRHLLAGRRPPGPPVYESLTSGAADRVPWEELRAGLRAASAEVDAILSAADDATPRAARVTAILVVSRREPDGRVVTDTWPEELDWKAYALVQRLHLLEHRGQVRALGKLPA